MYGVPWGGQTLRGSVLTVIIVCRHYSLSTRIHYASMFNVAELFWVYPIFKFQFTFRVEEQISSILDICRQEDGKACVKVFYDVSILK